MNEALKSTAKQQADEEDRNPRDFQAAQLKTAEARERELEIRRKEKEHEIDEIRKTQEREIDAKAERDAIMAERVELQHERRLRKREEADLRRSMTLSEDPRKEYRRSLKVKKEQRMSIADQDQADFEAQLEASKASKEAERQEQANKLERDRKYKADLRSEFNRLEEKRRFRTLFKQDEHRFFEDPSSAN
jgi:hypothetical protein